MPKVIDLQDYLGRNKLQTDLAENNREFIQIKINYTQALLFEDILDEYFNRENDNFSFENTKARIQNENLDIDVILQKFEICRNIRLILNMYQYNLSLDKKNEIFISEIQKIIIEEFNSAFSWIYEETLNSTFNVKDCFQ